MLFSLFYTNLSLIGPDLNLMYPNLGLLSLDLGLLGPKLGMKNPDLGLLDPFYYKSFKTLSGHQCDAPNSAHGVKRGCHFFFLFNINL